MCISDDGGFARNETRSEPLSEGPYFECVVAEEACEDRSQAEVEVCGCEQCQAFLAYQAEMTEAVLEFERGQYDYEDQQEAPILGDLPSFWE